MTDKQIEEFVKQVKSKKIRRNGWDKNEYIIPDGEYVGGVFYGIDEKGNTNSWWIDEGFNKDQDGYYWEFYNPFEVYLEEVLND